jgi:hypothetical protein
MYVHDAARVGMPLMDLRVKCPRGDIGRVRPVDCLRVVCIHEQEIARLDARKVLATRVNQEFGSIVRDRDAEVIGNRFVHAEPRSPAKGARKIDALLTVFKHDSISFAGH